MRTLSMLALLVFTTIAAAQSFALPVAVRDAPDGALLLREVEALARDGAVQVSGRVHRTLMQRMVVGRVILVTLRAPDGSVRASQRVVVDAARLPHHGPALSRFEARLPAAATAGDTVTVAIMAGDAGP